MRLYQLNCLIDPESKSKESEDIFAKIENFIQSEEGLLLSKETSLPLNLGSQIKKKTRAILASLELQIKADKIRLLKEKVDSLPQILRTFIVSKKAKKRPEKRKRPTLPMAGKKIVPAEPKKEKKVELREIEKKLDEILGET